jgi:hypothetical protein
VHEITPAGTLGTTCKGQGKEKEKAKKKRKSPCSLPTLGARYNIKVIQYAMAWPAEYGT